MSFRDNITIIATVPTPFGDFYHFTDKTGLELYCPIVMLEKAIEIADKVFEPSVMLEYDIEEKGRLGFPLYAFHVVTHAGDVIAIIRGIHPQHSETGRYGCMVLNGEEARKVFYATFGMTKEDVAREIQKTRKTKSDVYIAKADPTQDGDTLTLSVPEPFNPHTHTPAPVEMNYPEDHPLRLLIDNRDYSALAHYDYDQEVNQTLTAKIALESIMATNDYEEALAQALLLWEVKVSYQPGVEGQPLPYIGKTPLPTALAARMKQIIAQKTPEQFQQFVAEVRKRGTEQGLIFPKEEHQILRDPKDVGSL